MAMLTITEMVTHQPPPRPQPRFAEWLDHFEYSDAEFAELIGVTRQSVWRYRHFPNKLRPDLMARIAGVFGVHPEQLWQSPPAKVPLKKR